MPFGIRSPQFPAGVPLGWFVDGLTVDPVSGRLYYGDIGVLASAASGIMRTALDGTGATTLVPHLDGRGRGLAIDLAGGKMYFAQHNPLSTTGGRIWRANLDGSVLEVIVPGLNRPRDVALDLFGGRVYWTDEATFKIQSANLDGTGLLDVVTGLTGGPSSLTLQAVTNQPPVAQCQDLTIFTDTGLCTATISVDNASFDPDGDPITLDQVPPGPYSLGDNTVTLTVTDDSGASDSCMAVVTVVDVELPTISCVESVNPSGKNVPKARKVNEDGFYQVSAGDNCTVPEITLGGFTLAEGETIKITQAKGKSGVRFVNTMGPAKIRHFQVGPGDAVVTATDGAGNVATVTCLVPPPPK